MTRPLAWMTAVRDHPERPPVLQRYVLWSLALRMDWATGCGAASTGQLAADSSCDERTVRRATSWGRGHEMLTQTRRGHRIDAERTVASEWRLTIPVSQPDTGDLLATHPTGQRSRPNRTAGPTQPDTTTPPSRTRSSRPSPSARGDGANAPRPPREPQTLSLAPPCPTCGRAFPQRLLADPELRALALRGEINCSPECDDADMHCRRCGTELGDWQEDDNGLCYRCRNGQPARAETAS